ncbi:MAG: alpha-L-fucosidase [Phycisphaerales bacterium]|nr:alpha-L-fucosidase [Phycisphaerales bacterium]
MNTNHGIALWIATLLTCTSVAMVPDSQVPPVASPQESIPVPRPAQLTWQEAELGMLISYELHTFNPGRYNQPRARVTPIPDPDLFNPVELDTDQWVRAVKAGGGHFAILTASHESGFRLWQSDVNPYCLKAVRWGDGKRDIVAEFVASCRKYDIKPGIYMGTRWNAQLGVYNFKVTERSTISQEAYNRLIEREVEEICTRYGELFEIWFDGGAYGPRDGGPDVLSIVEKHQPQTLFYHNYQRADARWGGSESGTVPYPCWATMPFDGYEGHKKVSHANGFRLLKIGDPEGQVWCPAMSDAPLRGHGGHDWFWEPDGEQTIYPLDRLVSMYEHSVGHNSTLILGITPDTRGLLPEADVNRLAEFGNAIRRRYAIPTASVSGTGTESTLKFDAPTTVDRLILQEEIQQGERVREYRIDAWVDSRWREVATGSCIGHKRIQKISPVTTDCLRLVITSATAEPRIRSFAAFATEVPPPSFADRLEWVGLAVHSPGYHVWGTSPVISDDGKVHLFVARWPNNGPFDRGWRHDSEIAHYVGTSPEGPFTFSDVTLKGTGEDTWDRYAPSNPLIKRIDGKYVLLYIANPVGVTKGMGAHPRTQRIGMAIAESPEGPWEKVGGDGLVLRPSDDPEHWTANASNGVVNPAFLKAPDGRYFLYYKSAGARMGVAIAEHLEGPYVHQQESVTKNELPIEDGYAFQWQGRIHLLTTDNHGLIERGGGILWSSEDGLVFTRREKGFHLVQDYLPKGYPLKPRRYYGQQRKFERPQVLMIDGDPAYLYLPTGTQLDGLSGTTSYILRFTD